MTYKFTGIPIDKIEIGERRRTDMGDLDALARGIKRVGLLSPIVVDEQGSGGYRLVTGERRLRAVKMLGWPSIPVQLRSELTQAELRDIELEENENRKSLTEAERERTFAKSLQVVKDAKKAATKRESNSASGAELKRGPKPRYGVSRDTIAEDLGIGETSLREAEQHVETATQFPFMQDDAWRKSDVLRVRERLEEFPEEEREQAGAVLSCAKVLHPKTAVEVLDSLKAQPQTQRKEIYELSRSADPRDVSLALTRAAELPPMPDPRREILRGAIAEVKKAADLYPDDPLTPRIRSAADELAAVRNAIPKVQGAPAA